MLDSSSKRARSSITAVTSLPFRAASASTCTISESAPLRYKVCLIAKTCGSRAASRSKLITGAKDSNGWCNKMSCFCIAEKIFSDFFNTFGMAGVCES